MSNCAHYAWTARCWPLAHGRQAPQAFCLSLHQTIKNRHRSRFALLYPYIPKTNHSWSLHHTKELPYILFFFERRRCPSILYTLFGHFNSCLYLSSIALNPSTLQVLHLEKKTKNDKGGGTTLCMLGNAWAIKGNKAVANDACYPHTQWCKEIHADTLRWCVWWPKDACNPIHNDAKKYRWVRTGNWWCGLLSGTNAH